MILCLACSSPDSTPLRSDHGPWAALHVRLARVIVRPVPRRRSFPEYRRPVRRQDPRGTGNGVPAGSGCSSRSCRSIYRASNPVRNIRYGITSSNLQACRAVADGKIDARSWRPPPVSLSDFAPDAPQSLSSLGRANKHRWTRPWSQYVLPACWRATRAMYANHPVATQTRLCACRSPFLKPDRSLLCHRGTRRRPRHQGLGRWALVVVSSASQTCPKIYSSPPHPSPAPVKICSPNAERPEVPSRTKLTAMRITIPMTEFRYYATLAASHERSGIIRANHPQRSSPDGPRLIGGLPPPS